MLGRLEPDLSLTVLPFDYREPDSGPLPRDNPQTLVFSSHSIEVIPQLAEPVITGLLGLGRAVTGVHFEPVGWQIRENTSEIGATRAYSEKSRYNENLWPLLSQLSRRGLITLEAPTPDILPTKSQCVVSRRLA